MKPSLCVSSLNAIVLTGCPGLKSRAETAVRRYDVSGLLGQPQPEVLEVIMGFSNV
jgi:hypothetical protein